MKFRSPWNPTIIGVLFLAVWCTTTMGCTASKQRDVVVYAVGDSTVKNGQGDGAQGLWGWGDFIGQLLDSSMVRVENHALGGTSSRTFMDKGLWDSVAKKIQPGDFVLIQFGHNDDGPINDTIRARGTIRGIGEETVTIDNLLTGKHEIVHTYGWYLRKMVKESKSKGALPVLLSPIPRNRWKHGKVPLNNTDYGLWAKQIAQQEGIPFIDLNTGMAARMEALGETTVTGTYFYDWDPTHTSAQGAIMAAEVIVDGLSDAKSPLAGAVLDSPRFDLPEQP